MSQSVLNLGACRPRPEGRPQERGLQVGQGSRLDAGAHRQGAGGQQNDRI